MKMSFEEFCEFCIDAMRKDNRESYSISHPVTEFCEEWELRGRSGGSCYGDEAEYYTSEKKEPDFRGLDTVLEEFDASFKKYRRLMEKVVKGEWTDSGYYGNYTVYGKKTLPFKEVYEMLNE